MNRFDQGEWVLIFETESQFRAELRSGMLEENGIQTVVVNKQDSAYLFGSYEVYVRQDDVIQAKTLLESEEA